MHGYFHLPVVFDLFATFVFGMTGALSAIRRGYDYVGLLALTLVAGVGGGLIRDGIFIQNGPPALTRDSRYLLAILLAGIGGLLLHERVDRVKRVIAVLDAIGLGVYAVVGVQESLIAGLSVLAAILVGVVNSCGGGLLRDVLVGEEPLLFQPGQFYVLAAIGGCSIFLFLTLRLGVLATPSALLSIGFAFVMRMLAIHFNWRTGPVQRRFLARKRKRDRAAARSDADSD